MAGHCVYPDRAQVGRVSVLTKRKVAFFDAITPGLSSEQHVICSFIHTPRGFLAVAGGSVLVN